MLVVGFVVAFAGVGNPRLVGLASAFQLFYILASFPPYQPGTLPERLGGVTLAVVLLAAAEVFLWPDPVPVSYRQRLAEAADGVAAFLDATADALTDPHAAAGDRDARRERAYDVVAAIELNRSPPAWAPTAAGAQDRALRICAAALREVLTEADRLAADAPPQPIPDLAAARLLRSCADTTRAAGRSLSPGAPAVTPADLDVAVGRAEAAYPVGDGPGPRRAGRTPVVPGRDSCGPRGPGAGLRRRFPGGHRGAARRRRRLLGAVRVRPAQPVDAVLVAVPLPPGAALGPPAQLAAAGSGARHRPGGRRGVAADPRLLGAAGHPHGPAHVGRRHPHGAAAGRAGHDHRCGRQRRGDARRRRAGRVRHRPAGHPAAGLRRRPPARSGVAAGAVHSAADCRLRPTQPGRVAARRGPPRRRAARRGDRRARRRGDVAARRGPRPAAQRHPLPGGQRGRCRTDGPVDARRCSATRRVPSAGSVAGWS